MVHTPENAELLTLKILMIVVYTHNQQPPQGTNT